MYWNTKTKSFHRMDRVGLSAFTLIELMIVIVIIGIAAAIAVPMISSASSFQIRSAANMIAADMEYAKSMAIGTGQTYSVVFNVATESYQIEDSDGSAVAPPGRKDAVDFQNDGRLDRVDIVSANFAGTSTVTFDYLGSPQSSMTSAGVVTLQAGGITRTVQVEPVTGFISISD